MKRIILLVLVMSGLAIFDAQAQCSKAKAINCKMKTAKCAVAAACCDASSTTTEKLACAKMCKAKGLDCLYGAAYFASLDENIEVKKSTTSGEVAFFEKSLCSYSGNVSYHQVAFDANTGEFLNTAPETVEMVKNCQKICTPEQIARCKAKGIHCISAKASLASNEKAVIRP